MIIFFVILGVVICVVGIVFFFFYWGGMELAIVFLVVVVLFVIDLVLVIVLFKELGVSKKLNMLMEGESLFNDGVVVVVFFILVGIFLGISIFDLFVIFV